MATGVDISGLIKWAQRDEWAAVWEDVFLEPRRTGLQNPSISKPDDLAGIVGEDHFLMLWWCTFEDFLACPRPSDRADDRRRLPQAARLEGGGSGRSATCRRSEPR